MSNEYTLAELCIVAAAEAFRNEGEVLATGIGVIPRLAASLAAAEPVPLHRADQRGSAPAASGGASVGTGGEVQPLAGRDRR